MKPLPDGWRPPFRIFGWGKSFAVVNGDEQHTAIIDDLTLGVAQGIADMLNERCGVVDALAAYDQSLRDRMHGGVAAFKCIDAIKKAIEWPPVETC